MKTLQADLDSQDEYDRETKGTSINSQDPHGTLAWNKKTKRYDEQEPNWAVAKIDKDGNRIEIKDNNLVEYETL